MSDPTPLATGPTKWRAEHCTTHFNACDCREWDHVCEVERWIAERDNWAEQSRMDSERIQRLVDANTELRRQLNGCEAMLASERGRVKALEKRIESAPVARLEAPSIMRTIRLRDADPMTLLLHDKRVALVCLDERAEADRP